MKLDNLLRVFIGAFIIGSSVLGFFMSKYWIIFTIFIGLNLIQYSFTGFCLLKIILKKLFFRR